MYWFVGVFVMESSELEEILEAAWILAFLCFYPNPFKIEM